MPEPVEGADAVRVKANNPGPLTLSGTNTWVLGRDPAWVVDPGPADEAHLAAVAEAVAQRGGPGGIALTHGHADHSDGLERMRELLGGVAVLRDGAEPFGPLDMLPLRGHAADHVVFLWQHLCCSGDAVLGEGSVFVAGDMAAYLDGLAALRERAPRLILPGHGPVVTDAVGKLDHYVAHRLERERRLLAALEDGVRDEGALLDRAWDDAPAALRPAAALTMHAHMRKLAAEGRLPADVHVPPQNDLPHV